MGIKVEFNPDLALRNMSEFRNGNRRAEECIPDDLEAGNIYPFLKLGQRNFWLDGEVPLIETQGNEILSRPKAGIKIIEATHFADGGVIYTKGSYQVLEVFNDDRVHFDGLFRVGKWK